MAPSRSSNPGGFPSRLRVVPLLDWVDAREDPATQIPLHTNHRGGVSNRFPLTDEECEVVIFCVQELELYVLRHRQRDHHAA